MNTIELIEFIGIKISFAVAGLGGGVLRALSRKSFTLREMTASPICGALAASYLTTPVVAYLHKINWPLPEDAVATEHATAFLRSEERRVGKEW